MAAITVRQLRELLAELPDETIVVLSKDGEGNDFSPMQAEGSISLGRYSPHSIRGGEFHASNENEVVAICLWPTS